MSLLYLSDTSAIYTCIQCLVVVLFCEFVVCFADYTYILKYIFCVAVSGKGLSC